MRKPFFISLGIHIGIFLMIYIVSAFSAPMKPPQKVYSVRIIAAPRPPKTKIEDESKKDEPQPKPHIETEKKTRKKNNRKKKPKPKSKPKENKPHKNLARGSATINIEGQNFSDDFYLNLIMTKIANNWLNPLRGGRTMFTTVYFRIQRDGKVNDAKIEKESGNSLLDQSALRAVLASSPLPPLPESYSGDFLGVHFEFEHSGK